LFGDEPGHILIATPNKRWLWGRTWSL